MHSIHMKASKSLYSHIKIITVEYWEARWDQSLKFNIPMVFSSNRLHALSKAKALPVSYNTKQDPNNKRSTQDKWIKNLILKRTSYDSPTYITQVFQQTRNGYEARQHKYLTRLLEFEMWRRMKKSLHGCVWIIRVRWRDQAFDNFQENVWEAQGIHFSLLQTQWEHLGNYLEASTPIPESKKVRSLCFIKFF